MHDVTFDTALVAVMRQVDAEYRAQPTYMIYPKEAIIALDVDDQTFEQGLKRLVRAGFKYQVDRYGYSLQDSNRGDIAIIASPGERAGRATATPVQSPTHKKTAFLRNDQPQKPARWLSQLVF